MDGRDGGMAGAGLPRGYRNHVSLNNLSYTTSHVCFPHCDILICSTSVRFVSPHIHHSKFVSEHEMKLQSWSLLFNSIDSIS